MAVRDDFAKYLDAVLEDFRQSGSTEWEKDTLERFLDALSAYAGARIVDVVGSKEEASWALFARIVQGATSCE